MRHTKLATIDLRREEIDDARHLSVKQKLELGGDLFDAACEVTLSGIRAQHPGIGPDEAMQILRHRLALAREMETRL